MLDYRELITPVENPDLRQWQVTFDHRSKGRLFCFIEAESWQKAEDKACQRLNVRREDVLISVIHEIK